MNMQPSLSLCSPQTLSSISDTNTSSDSSSSSSTNNIKTMRRNTIHSNMTTPIATQPIPKKSQQIRTDKPRPHMCSVCTRAFARLEHLKRHERAHTNEKPYQCAACGRCFARRDLVLRHQQKLHSNLPTLMRKGSSKDQDINEHINVLQNNTDPNAPLPNGATPLPEALEGLETKASKPKFRTGLFGNDSQNQTNASSPHPSMGPSPITSNSSPRPSITLHSTGRKDSVSFNTSLKATPMSRQNSTASRRKSSQVNQEPSPESDTPKRQKLSSFKQSTEFNDKSSHFLHNYRHASYSAASGVSYANVNDARKIQEQNDREFGDSVPTQVEFGTPPLGPHSEDYHKIMEMGDLLDWGNVDHLDLGDDKFSLRQKSLKNLQDFFTLGSKNSNAKAVPMQHAQSVPQRKSIFAIEDETLDPAIGFPIQPPPIMENEPAALDQLQQPQAQPQAQPQPHEQQQLHQSSPQSLQGSVSSAGSIDPQQLSNKNGNPPSLGKDTRSSMEASITPQASLLGNGSVAPGSSINTNGWLKDLVNPGFDLNMNFSANTSFEDLKGYFDNQKPNENAINLPKKHAQDFMQQLLSANGHDVSESIDYSIEFPPNFFNCDSTLISAELRERMISLSRVDSKDFPSLESLKYYAQMFEFGFNRYCSFIHLPSLKNVRGQNFETIPLLLAITAIGSLYAYNSHDSLLLFNMSKYHIQGFFERELTVDNIQFKKIPLMAHQCLVLHIMLSLFFNEPNVIDITARQIKSMIGLIKSTNFNEPLEQSIIPPQPIPHGMMITDEIKPIIQHNYDYFILAQSRIRTLHTFYILQVFRSSVTGEPILFPSTSMKSGSYCNDRELWWSPNASSWYNTVCKSNPPNWSIIDLSNGTPVNELISYLQNPNPLSNIPNPNLLTILFNVHEQVGADLRASDFSYINWNMEKKPKYQHLMNNWQIVFYKNNGNLSTSPLNYEQYSLSPDLKQIIPLWYMLKMKLDINLDAAFTHIFKKDYVSMNKELDLMDYRESNYNVLSKSLGSAFSILDLWIQTTETNSLDVRETTVRTPVFLFCGILASVLVVATYLDFLEQQCKRRDISNQELMEWLRCQETFTKMEKVLTPSVKSVYSDVLTKDMQSLSIVTDSVRNKIIKLSEDRSKCDDRLSRGVDLDLNRDKVVMLNQEIRDYVLKNDLSKKAFYLGVRVFADAPVWPAAMGFAEALQIRSAHLAQQQRAMF
ncbi:hypothetical protein I9W82_002451 [Candida metapsilosis]|uniref:C2H2-type domain-containing protein n=1 Tax=Candida metapsilosis TaxID=273372 RepID=A0A8H7ZJ08_9ASCO|nr:hypothetical protein I9W82_002451 [Candida metapsilosis]